MEPPREPLAERMRPRTLDEFEGQEQIVGKGRLLRRAIQADMLSSLILCGPPGCGKTTLARIIANTTRKNFCSLNAVLGGVAEVRRVIAEATTRYQREQQRTILFVDEVHRWNKAQQDALLPWVENGTVVFIGATTHNPFFEVNHALLSRSRVFKFSHLTENSLRAILARALTDPERGYGRWKIKLEAEAEEHLLRICDGDARSLMNALQLAVESGDHFPPRNGLLTIDLATAEESIQKRALLYDKDGDYHFDTISAFIKSLRGSDPDAALYWMARMIAAGEDPRYLFRRMLILAAEDVGLADPEALVVTEAAAAAFERVGLPEGQFHLSEAVLYLATAPKSNSTIGYFDALKAVEQEKQQEPPVALRDASRDARGFGHGQGYLYPHAYRDHWVAQQYLPVALRGRIFYQPGTLGVEGARIQEIQRRREIQLAAAEEEFREERQSWNPTEHIREHWLRRAGATRSSMLEDLREHLLAPLGGQTQRVLLCGQQISFLLWEALRQLPEGEVVALCFRRREYEQLQSIIETLPEMERPLIVTGNDASTVSHIEGEDSSLCDLFLLRDGLIWYIEKFADHLAAERECQTFLKAVVNRLASGGKLMLAEQLPAHREMLSAVAHRQGVAAPLVAQLRQAEATLQHHPSLQFHSEKVQQLCKEQGLRIIEHRVIPYHLRRPVEKGRLLHWLGIEKGASQSTEPSAYAVALSSHCDLKSRQKLCAALIEALGNEVEWNVGVSFIEADKDAS